MGRTERDTLAKLAQKSNGSQSGITAQDIVDWKEKLMNLPTKGKEIREFITEDPKKTQIHHHNTVTIPQPTSYWEGTKGMFKAGVKGVKGVYKWVKGQSAGNEESPVSEPVESKIGNKTGKSNRNRQVSQTKG